MATWWLWIWLAVRLALFFGALMVAAMAAAPKATETETTWHSEANGGDRAVAGMESVVGLGPENPTQQREHRERSPIVVVLAEST